MLYKYRWLMALPVLIAIELLLGSPYSMTATMATMLLFTAMDMGKK